MTEKQFKYPEPAVIRRLTQWAPDPGAKNERASLNWQVNGSNMELLVWSKGPSEKGKPPIRAGINTLQVMLLSSIILEVSKSDGKTYRDLPLKNMRKVDKDDPKSEKELYNQSTVRVVKNTDGVVSIGVFDADETRTRILFPFLLDRWTGLITAAGKPLELSEVSVMVAKQYAKIIENIALKEIEISTNTEYQNRYQKPQSSANNTQQREPLKTSREKEFEDITY